MDKTAVVEMVWKQRHTIYSKQMRRVARFYVHDPENRCQIGDTVRIEETRPISRTKHWRLLEILQHRQLADVSPIELETDITPVMTGEALAEAPAQAQPAGEAGGEIDEDTDE
jgi:small subunit ribosomal protein S17